MHDLDIARRIFGRGLLLATSVVAEGPMETVLTEANIDLAFRRGKSAGDDPLRTTRTAEFPE